MSEKNVIFIQKILIIGGGLLLIPLYFIGGFISETILLLLTKYYIGILLLSVGTIISLTGVAVGRWPKPGVLRGLPARFFGFYSIIFSLYILGSKTESLKNLDPKIVVLAILPIALYSMYAVVKYIFSLRPKRTLPHINSKLVLFLAIPALFILFITWYICIDSYAFPSSEQLAREYVQTLINNDKEGLLRLTKHRDRGENCDEETLAMWEHDRNSLKDYGTFGTNEIRVVHTLGSFVEREGVQIFISHNSSSEESSYADKNFSLYTRYDTTGEYGFASRRYICGGLSSDIADVLSSTYRYTYSTGISLGDRTTYRVRVGYDGVFVQIFGPKTGEKKEKKFFIYPGDFNNFEKIVLNTDLRQNGLIPDRPCSAYTFQGLNLQSSKINLDGGFYQCPGVDATSSNKIVSGNLTGNVDSVVSAINSLIPEEKWQVPF